MRCLRFAQSDTTDCNAVESISSMCNRGVTVCGFFVGIFFVLCCVGCVVVLDGDTCEWYLPAFGRWLERLREECHRTIEHASL